MVYKILIAYVLRQKWVLCKREMRSYFATNSGLMLMAFPFWVSLITELKWNGLDSYSQNVRNKLINHWKQNEHTYMTSS